METSKEAAIVAALTGALSNVKSVRLRDPIDAVFYAQWVFDFVVRCDYTMRSDYYHVMQRYAGVSVQDARLLYIGCTIAVLVAESVETL